MLAAMALGAFLPLAAQSITGKVTDEQGAPLAYANVVALSLPDSAFVAGTISSEDGSFAFDVAEQGKLIRLSSVGYETYYAQRADRMGTIALQPFTDMLGEVVVRATLPKTRMKGDAMLTTVAGSVLEKAGSMNQLLDRIPNVTAQNGEIEVFGRGTPEIYINGRKMTDAMELERLNSDDIKSVEVITNPGARYSASVKAVIRITTKRVQGDGFGFDAQASFLHNNYTKWDETGRFNFNYRKKGFDLTGTLYLSNATGCDPKLFDQYTQLGENTYIQQSDIYSQYHSLNPYGKLALNYMFNPNHSVGVNFSYDYSDNVGGEEDSWLDMNSRVYENGQLTETSLSHITNDDLTKSMHGNLYYAGKVGDWSIDFNTDWYWNKNDNPQDTEESYQEVGQEAQAQTIRTQTLTRSRLIASKLVLTTPLWGGELGFGGEYSHSQRKNTYTVLPAGIIDDDRSRIEEGMASAFVDYSRTLGPLNLNAGVRYEHIDFDYYEDDRYMDEQSRIFDNVFPSVTLSAKVGEVDMQLGFATDVDRPSYWQLRSSVLYANRYTYETGNPLLTPEMSNNLNLGVSWKWINLNAVYSHVKDPILTITGPYSDDNPQVSLLRLVNGDAYDKLSASLTLQPTFGIWTPSLTAAVEKQWYDLTLPGGSRMRRPVGTFRFNNTFDTKWVTFSVLMNAATRGDDENIRVEEGFFRTDLSLYREFLKKSLTVQLSVNDLFRSGTFPFTMYTVGDSMTQGTRLDRYAQRNISLTVRYKFNVAKSKYKGSGAGQSQMQRM